MTSGEVEFLLVVVGAFSLFGSVLGWATWDEWRKEKAKK